MIHMNKMMIIIVNKINHQNITKKTLIIEEERKKDVRHWYIVYQSIIKKKLLKNRTESFIILERQNRYLFRFKMTSTKPLVSINVHFTNLNINFIYG